MKRVQQGFTLIELMIVVAIVGILLAIAIPAYQDYTCRAKISEALAAAAPAKTGMSEYYFAQNQFPTGSTLPFSSDIGSKYVQSVLWDSTNQLLYVTVQGSNIGCRIGDGHVAFQLSPSTNANNTRVDWVCQVATIGTAVGTQYLPGECQN